MLVTLLLERSSPEGRSYNSHRDAQNTVPEALLVGVLPEIAVDVPLCPSDHAPWGVLPVARQPFQREERPRRARRHPPIAEAMWEATYG